MIFIAAYTFLCAAAIFFLIRGLGAIAGLILGARGVITDALSQLAGAGISVPVWIPLCGAVAVCALRELPFEQTPRYAVAVTAASIVILLIVFAAAFLLTKVNGVFVHVAIGIIRMLLESGLF